MNKERLQTIKMKRAQSAMRAQSITPIGKGDRLWEVQQVLEKIDPSLKVITRQRSQAIEFGSVIKTKDVMQLLSDPELNCNWGVTPLDKIVEWAWSKGYLSISQLKQDFDLIPLGGSECTVEIACDPKRKDIIGSFRTGGLEALKQLIQQKSIRVATDTPGIAEYFFGSESLYPLSGSLEALPKEFAPILIGVVESGASLREEFWLRLADINRDAVLVRSQLMLVVDKRKGKNNENI